MSQPTRHDPYAALRIPNFRWFVASLMAMTVATQIQAVVVAWQIYELTHDPLSLGLIGLAEAVPFIGVALFAGHVADRVNRLRVSLVALAGDSGSALSGSVFGALRWGGGFAAGLRRGDSARGPRGARRAAAAPAVGAVLMSLVLAHLPPLRRAGQALLISVAVFGLSIIGFGLSRDFLLSIALLAVSGMLDTVSVVIRSTLLQVLTPDHLLGRVSSVNAIFIGSSNEIGAFESGAAARPIGTVPSVVLGGLTTLVVVAVTAVNVPQLRWLKEIR